LYRHPSWVFLHVFRTPKAKIPVQHHNIRHRHVLSNSSLPFILLFAATSDQVRDRRSRSHYPSRTQEYSKSLDLTYLDSLVQSSNNVRPPQVGAKYKTFHRLNSYLSTSNF
jgi:hypothetical protein